MAEWVVDEQYDAGEQAEHGGTTYTAMHAAHGVEPPAWPWVALGSGGSGGGRGLSLKGPFNVRFDDPLLVTEAGTPLFTPEVGSFIYGSTVVLREHFVSTDPGESPRLSYGTWGNVSEENVRGSDGQVQVDDSRPLFVERGEADVFFLVFDPPA